MTELFEDLGSVYLKIHTIAELNGVEDEPDAPVGNNENEKNENESNENENNEKPFKPTGTSQLTQKNFRKKEKKCC